MLPLHQNYTGNPLIPTITSPPSWRAHTIPPLICFWCIMATADRASLTLV